MRERNGIKDLLECLKHDGTFEHVRQAIEADPGLPGRLDGVIDEVKRKRRLERRH